MTLRFSARIAFAFWIFLQLLTAWLQIAGFSSVSGLAHLGGAAVGAAFFAADRWIGRERPVETAAPHLE